MSIDTPIPPDPEEMNQDRALWAGVAIAVFQRETGTDEEDALGDLLCDLMHWADRNRHDFEIALDRARYNYLCETSQEAAASDWQPRPQ